MKLKQYLVIAALLLLATAAFVQAGQPLTATRPTELTLLPGQPPVFQYRPDKASTVYVSNRSGAYTFVSLRAFPQDTRSPQRLNFLEVREKLDYESANKVALVNVRFDATARKWYVEYLDQAGDLLHSSAHPVVIAKQ